jgi:hypothetical protein
LNPEIYVFGPWLRGGTAAAGAVVDLRSFNFVSRSASRTLRSSPIRPHRSCFRDSFLRLTAPGHVTIEIVEIPTSFVPTYNVLILVWGTVYDCKHVFFLVSTDWKQSLKKGLNVLSSVWVSAHRHIMA